MHPLTVAHAFIWVTAAAAMLGVVIRPWGLPEAIWAVAGALLLVASSLLPASQAWTAVQGGANVYLFLAGMMLLAEVARRHGLFDWLAALAAREAQGSARRLFVLVYVVGVAVTMLLSNDATAVVLTPAVCAAARAVRAPPLPYVYICAFVANAASFILPISNPANLVVFGNQLPPLGVWLAQFTLPSLVAIVATFIVLRATQRSSLQQALVAHIELPPLSAAGRVAAGGILITVALLLAVSAKSASLGPPTFIAGALTLTLAQLRARQAPWPLLRSISWDVLLLVAGLFVLVAAIDRTGLLRSLGAALVDVSRHSQAAAVWIVGIAIALVCNIANNLPVALTAGTVLMSLPSTAHGLLADSAVVAVDLGPNLSRDRLAGDDSVADGTAPGKRAHPPRAIPRRGLAGHVAVTAAVTLHGVAASRVINPGASPGCCE